MIQMKSDIKLISLISNLIYGIKYFDFIYIKI